MVSHHTNYDANLYLRSFVDGEYGLLIARRMSDIVSADTKTRASATAMMLYPALLWAANTDVSGYVTDTDAQVQHGTFLMRAKALITHIEQAADVAKGHPQYGDAFGALLDMMMCRESSQHVSRYSVNKYLPMLMNVLSQLVESDCLDGVVSQVGLTSDSMVRVYNTSLAYVHAQTTGLWLCSANKHCGALSTDAEQCRQHVIALIKGLESLPAASDNYRLAVDSLFDWQLAGKSDETVAGTLELSTYTYSVQKRKALAALYALLYAPNADVLLYLITH